MQDSSSTFLKRPGQPLNTNNEITRNNSHCMLSLQFSSRPTHRHQISIDEDKLHSPTQYSDGCWTKDKRVHNNRINGLRSTSIASSVHKSSSVTASQTVNNQPPESYRKSNQAATKERKKPYLRKSRSRKSSRS